MFYNDNILKRSVKGTLKHQRKRGKKMNQKLKNKRGITLIALVVTIVVLLILAGVSISLILDNNGIIQKSKDAKREYGQARANEQADLDKVDSWIDEVANTPEIVEPENIDDWEYIEEDDGTITLTSYKGTDTTVIMPNSINGKRVKKISGTTPSLAVGTHKGYFSIWSAEIREGEEYFPYIKGQDTITKVIISPGIEEIESSDYGDGAFAYSTALEEIIIPDTIVKMGEGTFGGCKNLKKVNISKKLNTIDKSTFGSCMNLENIIIPSIVTTIESGALVQCRNLSKIIIPSSVTSIGDNVFSGCNNLLSITIPSSVTTVGSYVFDSIPSITVNVPFKEGEQPAGWNENWNATQGNVSTITVNYAK